MSDESKKWPLFIVVPDWDFLKGINTGFSEGNPGIRGANSDRLSFRFPFAITIIIIIIIHGFGEEWGEANV